jgi:hypothetical protein
MKNNHIPEGNSSNFTGKTIDSDILNKKPTIPNEIREPLPAPIVDNLPKEKPGPNRPYPNGTDKTFPDLNKPTFVPGYPDNMANIPGSMCHPPETNKSPSFKVNGVEMSFPAPFDKTLSDATNTKIAEASEILKQVKTLMEQHTTDMEVAPANNKVSTAQLER